MNMTTATSATRSPATGRFAPGQTLLFDADDTLWENNIYFERAIASFISFLNHKEYTAAEVREQLNHHERATIQAQGYGLQSFRQSLVNCFEELSTVPVTPEKHRQIVSFVQAIAEQEIELLPGVAETLEELSENHNIYLVTKGDLWEQTDKLTRSGLGLYFSGVEVLAEKHPDAYRGLVEKHSFDPATTWMIGNSPRSDINPSLAAGLHAVFIPHDHTWVLEHETVNEAPPNQRLLQLKSIAELAEIF